LYLKYAVKPDRKQTLGKLSDEIKAAERIMRGAEKKEKDRGGEVEN
jgi:hypothetical protein